MPDKPVWYDRLADAEAQLAAFPSPWIDRQTLESILGVGRRRAQQILQPLVRHTIGRNGLAAKEDLIVYLRQLAERDTARFERQRRQRLGALLAAWQREAKQHPRVLVEAPDRIVNQELDRLPAGIRLAPGQILIEGFTTPEDAKHKLLALIMAIGNDSEEFDRRIAVQHAPGRD
jgi:hypothetical protein